MLCLGKEEEGRDCYEEVGRRVDGQALRPASLVFVLFGFEGCVVTVGMEK